MSFLIRNFTHTAKESLENLLLLKLKTVERCSGKALAENIGKLEGQKKTKLHVACNIFLNISGNITNPPHF